MNLFSYKDNMMNDTSKLDFTKPIKSKAAVAFAAGQPLQIV